MWTKQWRRRWMRGRRARLLQLGHGLNAVSLCNNPRACCVVRGVQGIWASKQVDIHSHRRHRRTIKRERHTLARWMNGGGGVYFVECLQLRICLVSLFALMILNNNETWSYYWNIGRDLLCDATRRREKTMKVIETTIAYLDKCEYLGDGVLFSPSVLLLLIELTKW